MQHSVPVIQRQNVQHVLHKQVAGHVEQVQDGHQEPNVMKHKHQRTVQVELYAIMEAAAVTHGHLL